MENTFDFDEELRKLDEAHKAFEKEMDEAHKALEKVRKAKKVVQTQEGFCFDAFLKEKKITQDEFYNYPENKQEMIYAEYERRKWK